MRRLVALGLLGITGVVAACSASSTESASGPAGPDGGAATDAGVDATTRPPPELLEPSAYASLVAIDAKFPYGVTRVSAADDAIAGSRWGRHGGPMVTTAVYGSTGEALPSVVRWSLPAIATGAATKVSLPITIASKLPAKLFYGADGMVDLPFGASALLSYSGSGAPFSGEALLYSSDYDKVEDRASSNGFYSGIGITDGTRQRIIHSSLSALATAASTTNDNGLYAAEICGAALAPSPSCAAPTKLFGWKGASGPVVVDAHGNVFVGASTSGGATSDTVFGLTRAQAFAAGPQTPATLAGVDSGGTSTIAALPPEGALDGWVLGLGFDPKGAVYAASFVEGPDGLTKGAAVLETAITKGPDAESLSVFADNEGDLWVAVTTKKGGAFVELRRRAP